MHIEGAIDSVVGVSLDVNNIFSFLIHSVNGKDESGTLSPSQKYESRPLSPSKKYDSRPLSPSKKYDSRPLSPSHKYESLVMENGEPPITQNPK